MGCQSLWRPCERICGGFEKRPQTKRRGRHRNVCETLEQTPVSRSDRTRSRPHCRRAARHRRQRNHHGPEQAVRRPSQRSTRRCQGPGVSRNCVDPHPMGHRTQMTFEWRPYARPDGVPRQTKTTRSKALKTQNQADDVACERPHQNHDGLYLVVLFDLRRLTPGGLRMTAEGRMHGSDVAVGVRDRARRRHSRGALSVALRQPHGVGHLARSGVIEVKNPADDVAYEGCHRNHRGRLLVVLFDVRGMPSSCLREATAAWLRRSEFAGGVRIRSRCRDSSLLPSVHLRELRRVVHQMHTEACGKRWSRSRRRRAR